jgi:hypothetical protein
LADMIPQTARFNLSLAGYEPVEVTLNIIADQTVVCRTNLMSLRHGLALQEARQYSDAGNFEGMLQAANEALALKPDDAEALALQATATERLKADRQRADAERERLEQLQRPRKVFDALCQMNPDAALFTEHELKSSNPAKNVKLAIVQALQASPFGYQITLDRSPEKETYQVIAQQTFSLGFLGGNERVCLLVVGQAKEDETQIFFTVLDYQIQHTAVVNAINDIRDDKRLIPLHPSRMQMNDINWQHVQEGVNTMMERIQRALGQ